MVAVHPRLLSISSNAVVSSGTIHFETVRFIRFGNQINPYFPRKTRFSTNVDCHMDLAPPPRGSKTKQEKKREGVACVEEESILLHEESHQTTRVI